MSANKKTLIRIKAPKATLGCIYAHQIVGWNITEEEGVYVLYVIANSMMMEIWEGTWAECHAKLNELTITLGDNIIDI